VSKREGLARDGWICGHEFAPEKEWNKGIRKGNWMGMLYAGTGEGQIIIKDK